MIPDHQLVHSLFSSRFIVAWHMVLRAPEFAHWNDSTALLLEAAKQTVGPSHQDRRIEQFAPTGDTPHPEVLDMLQHVLRVFETHLYKRWPEIITQVFTEIAIMQAPDTPADRQEEKDHAL